MCKVMRIVGACMAAMMLCAASGCATGQMGGTNAKSPQWEVAMCAYTLRNFTLFEAIDKTKTLGLKAIEVYGWQNVGGDYPDVKLQDACPKIRDALKTKLDQTGIRIVDCYVRFPKDEPGIRKEFDKAKALAIKTLVAEPPAEIIGLLDKLAAEYGINIAIHNHTNNPKKPEYTYWKPCGVAKTIEKASRRIGACPDTGHWARSGVDTVAGLKTLQGQIIMLHLKDIDRHEREARDVPLGTGVANIKGILTELRRQGFSGVLSLEYEHNPEDNMADLAQCIDYVRQVTKELSR